MNRPPNHQETTTTTTTTTTNSNSNNKKTRDLPNLTECHSCGFRIDTCTNGKPNSNKMMQTLYSEWRIVLLCIKCFSRVQSSQICSYCFKDSSSSASCFRCTQCNHSIHKNCFSKHKSVAPWSYSCFPGQEFSVCVDCWVPKPLAHKRGAVLSSSRVVDANSVAEEKAEVAVRAREIAAKKAVVARKAVELANNALGLVVVAKEDSNKRRRRRRRRKELDDDAELAIRLHRAINSSPRMISRRNLCSLNSTCLDIPKNNGEVLYASRVTSVVSETTSSVSTTNVDCLKRGGGKVYTRKRKCGGRGRGGNEISIVKWEMKEGEESCSNKLLLNSSVDDNSMNSECNGERCDGKSDRYLLKYRKRKSGSKGMIPNSESKLAFLGECQASAAGLVLNCSNETRTLSNVAFRPCALSLQASASCDQS